MSGFIDRLRVRLAGDLPGEDAQFRMAPRARKRMHETASMLPHARQSAVLLYLFPDRSDWRIVLMKRTEYEGAHSGQVSIPGGQLEPGEDHVQAAVREFSEETGVAVAGTQLVGRLSRLFIPTSNFVVETFVAYGPVRPVFAPDPEEVERILEMRVSGLIDDETVKRGRAPLGDELWVETPYFDVDGHMVWGATAMILSEFKEILLDLHAGR